MGSGGKLFSFIQFFRRVPPKRRYVYGEAGFLVLGGFEMLLDQFGGDANYVLPLPVLDQVQRLKRGYDVSLRDTRHMGEVLDRQGAAEVSEDLQEDPGPVAPVAQLTQVG